MARNLNQKITHWVSARTFEGMSFTAPVVILGRWEDRTEQFIGNSGKEDISKSIIALDTIVKASDYLFLGVTTKADPRSLVGASEVKSYKEMEDLRNTGTERIAIL